jgi:hypothetical protein
LCYNKSEVSEVSEGLVTIIGSLPK